MSTVIQTRGDTAAQRTSKNPILAEREEAIETDTKLRKIGDGITAWNSLAYDDVRPIAEATILSMQDQATPTPPDAGFMNLFAKNIAGRMLPRAQGPSGLVFPLQPSLFQNNIFFVSPGTTSAMTVNGDTVTAVGTTSHPVATEAYGRMANIASASTANITAGVGSTNLLSCRGSVVGGANGFFFNSRFAFPDASYDTTGAGIGTRIFSGLTESTMAQVLTADTLGAYSCCGFLRTHTPTLTHTNRQFITRNGASFTLIDTGVPFVAGKVYDTFIFCPPVGNIIGWRIDNVTDDITVSGSTSDTLPLNTAFMRCGVQLTTLNAVSRNLRIQRLYLESDR